VGNPHSSSRALWKSCLNLIHCDGNLKVLYLSSPCSKRENPCASDGRFFNFSKKEKGRLLRSFLFLRLPRARHSPPVFILTCWVCCAAITRTRDKAEQATSWASREVRAERPYLYTSYFFLGRLFHPARPGAVIAIALAFAAAERRSNSIVSFVGLGREVLFTCGALRDSFVAEGTRAPKSIIGFKCIHFLHIHTFSHLNSRTFSSFSLDSANNIAYYMKTACFTQASAFE
jgi:hypothetical protein